MMDICYSNFHNTIINTQYLRRQKSRNLVKSYNPWRDVTIDNCFIIIIIIVSFIITVTQIANNHSSLAYNY